MIAIIAYYSCRKIFELDVISSTEAITRAEAILGAYATVRDETKVHRTSCLVANAISTV